MVPVLMVDFNGLIWCSCLVFVSMFGVCIGGAGFNDGFWWVLMVLFGACISVFIRFWCLYRWCRF